jgi:hypothetical protein
MKPFLITLLLAGTVYAQAELPANHVDLSSSIIEFLSRTELCLNTCQSAETVQAAIPQLKELREECQRIIEMQHSLPEPTVQDFMAVQHQMEAFNLVWNAIRAHITRLENQGLLTAEICEIVGIATAKSTRP